MVKVYSEGGSKVQASERVLANPVEATKSFG